MLDRILHFVYNDSPQNNELLCVSRRFYERALPYRWRRLCVSHPWLPSEEILKKIGKLVKLLIICGELTCDIGQAELLAFQRLTQRYCPNVRQLVLVLNMMDTKLRVEQLIYPRLWDLTLRFPNTDPECVEALLHDWLPRLPMLRRLTIEEDAMESISEFCDARALNLILLRCPKLRQLGLRNMRRLKMKELVTLIGALSLDQLAVENYGLYQQRSLKKLMSTTGSSSRSRPSSSSGGCRNELLLDPHPKHHAGYATILSELGGWQRVVIRDHRDLNRNARDLNCLSMAEVHVRPGTPPFLFSGSSNSLLAGRDCERPKPRPYRQGWRHWARQFFRIGPGQSRS